MHNIFLIARREYLERVRTRSFVVMTFFIPALMVGLTVVPTMLMQRGSKETKHMVVVAADRDTAEMIRSRIEQEQDQTASQSEEEPGSKRGLPPTHFTVEVSTNATPAEREALTQKVNQKQLDGFLWATPDAIAAKKLDFVTNDTSSFIENGALGDTVADALLRHELKTKGLQEKDIEGALERVKVEPVSPKGKNAPDPQKLFIATMVMVMVIRRVLS